MTDLYVEIDAHGVFPQTLRAAQRHALDLYVVTRDYFEGDANVHLIVIEDDQANGGAWILANIRRGDICVTADSGLAVNCILRGAQALTPSGRQWGVDAVNDDTKAVVEPWATDVHAFAERLEKAIVSLRNKTTPEFARRRAPQRSRYGMQQPVSRAALV
jgi:uncharacterized protein YaiI (UPF0178 family)